MSIEPLLARPVAVAILVAHPDDEVIGAGAQLPNLPSVHIIHTSDGAPRNMVDAMAHGFSTRQAYARARRDELTAALNLAGVDPGRCREIGLADQETSLHLADLARQVSELLRELRPSVVLTHPYEGGHPDHDATAFSAHAARALLEKDGIAPPGLIELASYHARDGQMEAGAFLPSEESEVTSIDLNERQRELKRRMMDCFTTQQEMLRAFPVGVERFRPAPRYDFSRPPHPGPLLYEHFDWGMQGDRWRALAREAASALHISTAI